MSTDTPPLAITPVSTPVQGRIRPPGSKSITNRALILAAGAEGKSLLTGVLDSQDTRVMVDSLRQLGLELEQDLDAQTIRILGCAGKIPAPQARLWLENSGTSIRFLTAFCSAGTGTYHLDGNARMRQRPIGELLQALNQLGATACCGPDCDPALADADAVTNDRQLPPDHKLNNGDCPPVLIQGQGLSGGEAVVGGNISSQYLSALLMVSPLARQTVHVRVAGMLVSVPYITLTLRMMQAFGIDVETGTDGGWSIVPQRYPGREYHIEPDASAASYFFAAAAITGGQVTVQGLSRNALQGDVAFVDALEAMGCQVQSNRNSITVTGGALRGIDIDMNAISDTAQTLAAVAPFASGPTRIRNIAHVRHKETDRIAAVATELRRLGQTVIEHEDGLEIFPAPVRPAVVQTYDDHRMAMSFALVGLKAAGIQIADPGCTDKTYPQYFRDLQAVCTGD